MHPFLDQILKNIKNKKSCLCVGLDPDPDLLPVGFSTNCEGILSFLKEVVTHTQDVAIAYKPNLSFFEALGLDGLKMLQELCESIEAPIIMDAKRGDIGNTSRMQATYIFKTFNCDAVTVNPYMGEDSVAAFFDYRDKFHFVLALTSNPGAADFEKQQLASGQPLYQAVADKCEIWQSQFGNVGMVVGATQSELKQLRAQSSLPFLIPGVGAQGGDYLKSVQEGQTKEGIVLVNVGRHILYQAKEKSQLPEALKKISASFQFSL